eukprot:Gb_41116 [translate_table: standard]
MKMWVLGRWARAGRARQYTLGAAALTLAVAKFSYEEELWGGSNAGQFLYGRFEEMSTVCRGLVRSSRAIYTFTVNSLDYKYSLRGYDDKSDEYYEIRSQVHLRAAKRILKLCEANKGFYIKAGQFMASMQQVPKEYIATLSILQDQAIPCNFRAIKQVFKNNFGKDLSDIYVTFDEKPIAAASIAQVHHATLSDGKKVAVKVQYPGLQQQLIVDITTMAVLSKAISWIFPDYQFEWIVPEFEKTLSKELDFVQEAENAERTARNFRNNSVVKIPLIFWDLTTRQVLTMQLMHGCKVDNLQCLLNAGLDPTKVAQSLLEVFAEMIFVHGYVHGDPHPGNILISPHTNKSHGFDIVLLDHGIYRELDEGFRIDFCHLWKALILSDRLEMQHMGERLGAGNYYRYLPVIFTGRTIESKSVLGKGMSTEERKRLRQEVRQFTVGDVSQFMEGLPRDLLTVLRTDGLLRSIISKLGAPQRVRLLANAKYAVSGLVSKQKSEPGLATESLKSTVKATLDYAYLRLCLELLELHYKMGTIYQSILEHCKYWFSKFAGYLLRRLTLSNVLL